MGHALAGSRRRKAPSAGAGAAGRGGGFEGVQRGCGGCRRSARAIVEGWTPATDPALCQVQP